METQSIDVIQSRPGIYAAVTALSFAFVEVLPDGSMQQLRPTDFARDGELSPGGWRKGVAFYGPLARPAEVPHGST